MTAAKRLNDFVRAGLVVTESKSDHTLGFVRVVTNGELAFIPIVINNRLKTKPILIQPIFS